MIDYDAVWDAWLGDPAHASCDGFLYDPSAGVVRCGCGGVVRYVPAGPEPATDPAGSHPIHLRRLVGHCAHCGAPILDSGYSDDPELWEHGYGGDAAGIPSPSPAGPEPATDPAGPPGAAA